MGKAGAMDQPIALERKAATADGGGGEVYTWAPLPIDPRVWASVKAKAGREAMDEGRTSAAFVVLFTIYNRADLTETDRIIWDGVAYNIQGIRREGGRDLRLVIEAERGVAQ